jgi:hypothetical protein
MNTKDFTDPDEAIEFVKLLQDNNTVDVLKTVDGAFRINWVENKKYTTHDGKEFIDEVWTKEDGTMIACQDLELDHAKNIIRMILRQERERSAMEAQLYNQMQAALQSIAAKDDEDDGDIPVSSEEVRVLH